MTPQIPESLKSEHAELHATLAAATRAGGRVGEAARRVAEVLHAHFVREEEVALPPLGLLEPLARGEVAPAMAGVLELTEALKAELPQMLEEHRHVRQAVAALAQAAEAEERPEYAEFARKLALHARTEEEVLYPAAVLVGEYLKLKLKLRG